MESLVYEHHPYLNLRQGKDSQLKLNAIIGIVLMGSLVWYKHFADRRNINNLGQIVDCSKLQYSQKFLWSLYTTSHSRWSLFLWALLETCLEQQNTGNGMLRALQTEIPPEAMSSVLFSWNIDAMRGSLSWLRKRLRRKSRQFKLYFKTRKNYPFYTSAEPTLSCCDLADINWILR